MRSQLNSIERLIAAAKCKKQRVTTPYTEKPFPLFPQDKSFFFLASQEQMWTKCSL